MKSFLNIGIPFAFAMLVSSSITPYVWGQSMGLSAIDTEIYPRDDIFVTGFVNTDSFYKTVRLTVYDPGGDMLYRPDITYDDQGRFSWLFHPPIPQFETGIYTVVASHEDISETTQLQFKVVPKPTEQPANPVSQVDRVSPVNQKLPASENPNNSVKTTAKESIKSPDLKGTIESTVETEFIQSTEFAAITGTVITALVVGIALRVRSSHRKQTIHK